MRRTLSEETLQAKEAYERLMAMYGTRGYAYTADNWIFSEPLFKDVVHTCGQEISSFGLVYHYQNEIV